MPGAAITVSWDCEARRLGRWVSPWTTVLPQGQGASDQKPRKPGKDTPRLQKSEPVSSPGSSHRAPLLFCDPKPTRTSDLREPLTHPLDLHSHRGDLPGRAGPAGGHLPRMVPTPATLHLLHHLPHGTHALDKYICHNLTLIKNNDARLS